MADVKFGFEIEFNVAYPSTRKMRSPLDLLDTRWPHGITPVDTDAFTGIDIGNSECILKIASLIASLGLPTACVEVSHDNTSRERNDTLYGGSVLMVGTSLCRVWNQQQINAHVAEEQFSYWFVGFEAFVNGDRVQEDFAGCPRGHAWFNLEISSPVIANAQEIAQELPTVRRVINHLRQNVKLWMSKECGFHIHASPHPGGFDLNTARAVSALTFLLEDMLFDCCHDYRRQAHFCRPLKTNSLIGTGEWAHTADDNWNGAVMAAIEAAAQQANEPPTPRAIALFNRTRTILRQESVQSLRDGFREDPPGNWRFESARLGMAFSNYGSTEFRYPQALFEADFVAFWVTMVAKLYEIAQRPTAQFANTIAELFIMSARATPAPTVDLLPFLGLGRWVPYFNHLKHRYANDLKDLDKKTILSK